MKRHAMFILLLMLAVTAGAQNPTAGCDMSTFETAETTCRGTKISQLEVAVQTQVKAAAKPAAEAKAVTELSKTNKATTAPDPFAAHLHNSYQDFLTPISMAINKVEESKDGRALIVRFNPIRNDDGINGGITATAAKPSVFDKVSGAIPEASRTDTVNALEKNLGDLDDITLSGSFTATRKCAQNKVDQCFGRDPATYRDLVSDVLVNKALDKLSSPEATAAAQRVRDLAHKAFVDPNTHVSDPSAFAKPFGEIKDAALQREIYDQAVLAGRADVADTQAYLQAFHDLGIDQLSTLIDNQPQLSATVSYHNLGKFGGPDETAATLEYQTGVENLRSVNRTCSDSGGFAACLRTRLANVKQNPINSDKFVVSFSYKRSDHYKLDSLGSDFPNITITPVDIPRASDWQGKLQWGRKLSILQTTGNQQTRIDISGDFHRQSESGARKLNRVVSTATLTIPYGDNMSIPVSLSYANKPDFLKDERKKLSMHFGLSYRFPWEKKPE